MVTLDQIAVIRDCGYVNAREEAQAYAQPQLFAQRCGLSAAADIYREIDAAEALAVLEAVLHEDMAYGVEIMPRARAREIAQGLLAGYAGSETRYFTNGEYGLLHNNPNAGPGWNPATDSTFDTGVLVLASDKSLCLWVEDED